MKNIFKYSLALLTVVLGFASCDSEKDENYEPAVASGSQVFFSSELPTVVSTPISESSFTIPVSRYNTDGEQTVALNIKLAEGCIYTPADNKVTFAAGSKTANLVFNYNPADVKYGTYYDISVEIADASAATPYGNATLAFKAGMTEWKKMSGKATFNDDLVCGLYGITTSWTVDIEESVVEPGRYRLVAPWGPNTAFPSILYEQEILPAASLDDVKKAYTDTDQNTYMVINAQDPKAVWIEATETGYKDLAGGIDPGAVGVISYVDYYIKAGKYTLEEYKAKYPEDFGILDDGVITFPTGKEILVTLDGALKYYGNTNSQFAIALPGHSLKDFSAEVEYLGIFTNPAGDAFATCNLTLGADASNAKAVVIEKSADDNAVADAIAAGELEAIAVKAGNNQIPLGDKSGELKIVVVVLDNDTPKTVAVANFEYYGGGANPWKSLGKGAFIDDVICPLFNYSVAEYGNVYPVEIDESTNTPGLYRLKAMFSAVAADFGVESGTGDVLVHAENPNAVYIPLQPLELTLGSNGPFSISTDAGELVEEYGFDAVYAQLPNIFGKLENGVMTFPLLDGQSSSEDPVQYQLYAVMGERYFFAGTSGSFTIYLPGATAEAKAKAKRAAMARRFANSLKGVFGKPSPKKQFALRINKYSIKNTKR